MATMAPPNDIATDVVADVVTCLICRESETVDVQTREAGWSPQGLFCTNEPQHWICSPCLARYICSGCEGLQADVESVVMGGPGGKHISNRGDLPCPLFKPGECKCGQMPRQRLCAFFGICPTPLVGQAMVDFFAARERVAVEVQLDTMRQEEETRKTLQARTALACDLVTTSATHGHQVSCPICGMAWHKDDACMHMTCRRCLERFCYVCGRILSDEGCPPGRGCDRVSSLLENNEPWEGLTGQEALTCFQIVLIKFYVGLARLLVGPLVWEELMTLRADLLRDVIPGHSFEAKDLETLPEPPLCGLSVLSVHMRHQETFRRQCEVLGVLLPQAVSLWNLDAYEEALVTWRMTWSMAVAGNLLESSTAEEDNGTSTFLALLENLTAVQIHTLRVVWVLVSHWAQIFQKHCASTTGQTDHQTCPPPSPSQALAVLQEVSWDAIRALERLRDYHWPPLSDPSLLGATPEEQIAVNDILAVWQDDTDFLVVSGADVQEDDGSEGLNGRYWRCGVHNERFAFRQVMGRGHMYWSHGMWRLGDSGGWSEWRFAIRSMAMLPPMQNRVWTEEGHEVAEGGLLPRPHAAGPTVSLLSLLEIEQDLLQGIPQPPILRLTKVYTPNPFRARCFPKVPLTYDFIPLDVSENGQRVRYKRRGMPEYIEFDVDMDMWCLKAPPARGERSEPSSLTERTADDDIHPYNESLTSILVSVTPPEGGIGLHLRHGPQEDGLVHLSLGYQLPPRGLWTWDGHEPSEQHPPLALLECILWDEVSQYPAPLAISISNAGQEECNGVYVPVALGRRNTPVYQKRGSVPLTLLQQPEGHWQITQRDGVPIYASSPLHATTFYPPEGKCWHLTQIFQKMAPDKVSWPTKSSRPLVEYIMHEAPSCALSLSVFVGSAVGLSVRLLPHQISRPATQAFPYAPWTPGRTAHVDCLGIVVDLDTNNVMKVAFPTLPQPLRLPAACCTFHTKSPLAASYPLEVWVSGAGLRVGSSEGGSGSLDGVYCHTLEDLCGKPIYRNMTHGALIYFKHGHWKLSPGSITGWFYTPQTQTHFYDPPGGPWEADAPIHLKLHREAYVHVVRPVEVTVTAKGGFGGAGQYRQTKIFKGRPCYTQLSTIKSVGALGPAQQIADSAYSEEPYMIWWNPQGWWQLGLKASGKVMFYCKGWHAEPPASDRFTEWIPAQWDSGAICVNTQYLTQADLIARDYGPTQICANTLVRLRPAAVTREMVKAYAEHMTSWDKEHLEACGRVGRVVYVTDKAMAMIQFDHPTELEQTTTRRLLFPVACCVTMHRTDVGLSLPRLRDKLGPTMVERMWVQVSEKETRCHEYHEPPEDVCEISEIVEISEISRLGGDYTPQGLQGLQGLQGFYGVCGVFMDHPKYRQEKGEGILYFLDTWKLHYEDDVGQWAVRAPCAPNGASTYVPPVHGWVCHGAMDRMARDRMAMDSKSDMLPIRHLLAITVSPAP